MQWVGKALGAALGMAVLGPWGSIVGVLLGHQFDQGLGSTGIGSGQGARQLFFTTTFEVMGHVAKADGRVSEADVQTARRIMHSMKLGPEQVRQAIEHYTAGKQADYPLMQRLDDLLRPTGQRQELARAFIEIQLQAAIGSGEIAQGKRELLWLIARRCGLNRVELAQIEAALRSGRPGQRVANDRLNLDAAYRTLGIATDASDREVKTAYRRMMNTHHPDKLKSKGLPESMASVAEERTQQIRAAYDRVKAARGLR
jgi:DnaJ like chaperone protein